MEENKKGEVEQKAQEALERKRKIIEKKQLEQKLKQVEKEARQKAIKNRAPFKGLQISPTVSWFDESGRQKPGEHNWKGFGFDIHPQVTLISVAILAVLIGLILSFPTRTEAVFNSMMNGITKNAGWFLVFASNIFIIAGLYFAFSRYGKIKIGGAEAKPEFTKFAWYAMLLSAGMGIGLMFWSVAEPISHLYNPSPMFGVMDPGSPEAAQSAMASTFFHWGLHPWAIYALVGLALAFFAFNRGLPLTMRSVFYPLIGNKIYGIGGNIIDVLSVLATLTGLATSLGMGVSQVNAGLNHLFGISISVPIQIGLIFGITALATTSVVLGLDGGVKRLSELNMIVAGAFMIFIMIAGPTVYILSGFTQNIGYYAANFIQMSTWTETFRATNWQGGWTIFYWAWWISWSPFVGMFIARISKGRTVREFILGVMLIPSLLSCVWMSVFGGTAISLETSGAADILSVLRIDEALAMFAMLDALPLRNILSVIGILLVTVFFVTSSDSGSLVVDHLTSGGKLNSPVPQRIFWAVLEGVVAAVLLVGGGLTALQTGSIVTGLPFAVILLIMIYTLNAGLKQEYEIEQTVQSTVKEVRQGHVITQVVSTIVHDEALVETGKFGEIQKNDPEQAE